MARRRIELDQRALRQLQLVVSVITSGVILAAHLTFYRFAGGLWRDEVNSVNLATAPSLFSDWARYQFDSFPIGWFVVLRSWIVCFSQGPDFHLRVFGLMVGVLVLAMICFAARSFGADTPTISLVLFGLSATTVRYGDSIRGYGLGVLLAIAVLVAYWRVCQKEGRARVWIALGCSFLAVHFLFHNAIVVFAATISSATLLLTHRRLKAAAGVFAGAGAVAASLLIYAVPMRAASRWNYVFRQDLGFSWFLHCFTRALNLSGPNTSTLWLLASAFAAAVLITSLLSGRSRPESMVIWYCAITIVTGLTAYLTFLYVLRYPTLDWYYLVAMALAAVCLDGILTPREGASGSWRVLSILFMVVVTAVSIPPLFSVLSRRQTTVDLAASYVTSQAASGDMVLVYEWMNGITFGHYYRGAAPWQTVPPMTDHSVHRYDLLLVPSTFRATAALNSTVAVRIRSGGKIWIVTSMPFPLAGQPPYPEKYRGETLFEPWFLNHVAFPLAAISEPCGPPVLFRGYPAMFETVGVECRQARRR